MSRRGSWGRSGKGSRVRNSRGPGFGRFRFGLIEDVAVEGIGPNFQASPGSFFSCAWECSRAENLGVRWSNEVADMNFCN
jgi:hypothetical protein